MDVNDNGRKDYKYEHTKTLLTGLESKYIYIPLSVIVDKELDIKRVGIFSYLRIHCGLNDMVGFTIPDMVEWCSMKPNKSRLFLVVFWLFLFWLFLFFDYF